MKRASDKDLSLVDALLSGGEAIELTEAGQRIAGILQHAGKWPPNPIRARVAALNARFPELIGVQVAGRPEFEAWHRSFWKIAGPAVSL